MEREAQVVPPPPPLTLPTSKLDFFRDYAKKNTDDDTRVPDTDKFRRRVTEEEKKKNLDKVEMVAALFLADLKKECVPGDNVGPDPLQKSQHRWQCIGGIWVEFHHGVPPSMGGHDPKYPSGLNLYPLVPKNHLRVHCYLAILFPEEKKLAYAWSRLLYVGKTHRSGQREWSRESASDLFPEDPTWKQAYDRAVLICNTWNSIDHIKPPSDDPAVNKRREQARASRVRRQNGEPTHFTKAERDAVAEGAEKHKDDYRKWVLTMPSHTCAEGSAELTCVTMGLPS